MTMPFLALVRRELLTNLRKRRSFVCVVLLVGICALMIAVEWPHEGIDLRGANAQQYASHLSQQILGVVSFALLAACGLFVPALASGTILSEREQGSFEMLRLTLISPRGMVLGKLLNTLGVFVLIAASALPMLALTFFLVGLDWTQLAATMLILVQSMVSAAILGMLCAAACRKAFKAIGLSYLAVAVVAIGPILFPLFAPLGSFPRDTVFVSPITALATTAFERTSGEGLAIFFISHMLLCLVCWCVTLRLLMRAPEPEKVESEKPIDDTALLQERRKTFPFYLLDPMRRKEMIEDGRNPMQVKELRWGLMGKETLMARIFYVIALASFALGISFLFIRRGVFYWYSLQIFLVVFLTPVFLSNMFTKEHAHGNLDMLRVTLLKPKEIVLGKLFAAVLSLLPFLGAMLVAGIPILIAAFAWFGQGFVCFQGLTTVLVCTLVSLAVSLLASVLTKRTTTALFTAYAASAMLYAGLYVGAGCVVELAKVLTGGTLLGPRKGALLSPIVSFVNATQDDVMRSWNSYHRLDDRDAVWFFSMILFTVIALATIRLALFVFGRYRMSAR
jgi:ABC-type transport system involved in multi-copper enzyme maturation permease subunit